jgi:phosphatidylserine/phosphatidylglycerophosphate/cardiolipin synthase-like enzyme
MAKTGTGGAGLAALRKRILDWERRTFGAPPAVRRAVLPRALAAPPTWHDVGPVTTAVSPDCSFFLLKGAIDAARTTLRVYVYNLTSDAIVDAIAERKKAGVDVRLMYDTIDSQGGEKQDVKRLRDLGVKVMEAPSVKGRRHFTVCHQKFVVADEHAVCLGSANYAESSIPELKTPGEFKKGNREWLVRVDAEPVAKWFADLFDNDWDLPATRELARPLPPMAKEFVILPRAVTPAPKAFALGEFGAADAGVMTPIISPVNYRQEVEALIRSATRSIDIQQQYIKAGGPEVEALIDAVRERSTKNVTVRIMISPAFPESWEQTVATLKQFKLMKYLRAMKLDHYKHLHNKGVLVDGKAVVVSSTNWSNNSVAQAREAGMLIRSKPIATYYKKAFDRDWSNGMDPDDATGKLTRMLRGLRAGAPGEADILEASEGV